MKFTFKLLVVSVLLVAASAAFAAGFTDTRATVVANGTTCNNTTVQFIPSEGEGETGKIIVSGGRGKCKKIGFAKRLGELSDVTWNDRKKTVDFTVEGDQSYSITVNGKANYTSIRQALIDAI